MPTLPKPIWKECTTIRARNASKRSTLLTCVFLQYDGFEADREFLDCESSQS